MIYLYKDENGEVIEKSFSIGKAPDEFKEEGILYKRFREGEMAGQQFILKGSGWPGQTEKRKKQMTEKNINAGKRTRDTWGEPKSCLPNYKGEVVDTWRDAQALAEKDKGE